MWQIFCSTEQLETWNMWQQDCSVLYIICSSNIFVTRWQDAASDTNQRGGNYVAIMLVTVHLLRCGLFRRLQGSRVIFLTASIFGSYSGVFAGSTRGSPEKCGPLRHLKWERLLTLFFAKPMQKAEEIFNTCDLFIYGDTAYITNSFYGIVLRIETP